MIGSKTVLGLIVARGGSKGLPRKNVLPLGDFPLVAWSVAAGLQSRLLDRLVLSSEDAEIISIAEKWGCDVPFVRPASFSEDDSKIADVVLDALDALDETYDYFVLLQTTSPLRTGEDIDACIETCVAHGASTCVSVCAAGKSPFWMYSVDPETRRMTRVAAPPGEDDRRQDLPEVMALNGAVYVADVGQFRETKQFCNDETVAYVMPADRSVDIDGDLDLMLAEAIVRRSNLTPDFAIPDRSAAES